MCHGEGWCERLQSGESGLGSSSAFLPFTAAVLVAAPERAALIPAAAFLQLFQAAEVVPPVPAGSAGPQLALCILAEEVGWHERVVTSCGSCNTRCVKLGSLPLREVWWQDPRNVL